VADVTSIDPEGLAPAGATWSQATVVGELVFVSGQIAWDPDGRLVGAGSIERQTEVVFDNLERALAAAGSGLDRLARICVYLVDRSHIAAFRAVRDQRLRAGRPASTLVIVEALVDDEALVEVDAVATR
jgi:enamine deaminase RidA (YjgF/YER057c/UK114 family)